jgi:hypothetical protein
MKGQRLESVIAYLKNDKKKTLKPNEKIYFTKKWWQKNCLDTK